jgi:hypothetical protein
MTTDDDLILEVTQEVNLTAILDIPPKRRKQIAKQIRGQLDGIRQLIFNTYNAHDKHYKKLSLYFRTADQDTQEFEQKSLQFLEVQKRMYRERAGVLMYSAVLNFFDAVDWGAK